MHKAESVGVGYARVDALNHRQREQRKSSRLDLELRVGAMMSVRFLARRGTRSLLAEAPWGLFTLTHRAARRRIECHQVVGMGLEPYRLAALCAEVRRHYHLKTGLVKLDGQDGHLA